jgi:hypothetical protein
MATAGKTQPPGPAPLTTLEAYRDALAEIRRLRAAPAGAGRDRRLAEREAAAADYAERLRDAELATGRPERSPPAGAPARLADAPLDEPSAEDPPPAPERASSR